MTDVQATVDTAPLYAALARTLNAAGRDWVEMARKAAPVRKPDRRTTEPGARSEQFPIRLRSATTRSSGFSGSSRKLSKTQLSLQGYIEAEGRSKIFRRLVQRHGTRANTRLAQLFTITKGPHRGQVPTHLVERGTRLLGVVLSEAQGGELRDSIGFDEAVVDGNRVTIVLKATSGHAAPVEFGFKHKGGGQIPGKSFMRGPLFNYILPGLREGRYNRG